jgi:hypothetical protein
MTERGVACCPAVAEFELGGVHIRCKNGDGSKPRQENAANASTTLTSEVVGGAGGGVQLEERALNLESQQ